MCVLSHVQLFATLFVPHQAPPSMGFSWQEFRTGLPFPPPGIFPTQGSNHVFCTAGGIFTTEPPGKTPQWTTTQSYKRIEILPLTTTWMDLEGII